MIDENGHTAPGSAAARAASASATDWKVHSAQDLCCIGFCRTVTDTTCSRALL
jgi:hypothetical protein